MKVEAQTIEQFFEACKKRESAMRELEKLISSELGEQPTLFSGMGTVRVLAWRLIDYRCKSDPKSKPSRKWPLVALAPQKNYLAIYFCSVKDGKYLVELYQDKLGKVSCGKSCIRFKKLEDLNKNTVKLMLRDIENTSFGI